MTDRQDNLHTARVEAAARALRDDEEFMEEVSSTLEVSWSNRIASTALNAADNLVTVEKIAEVIGGRIMDGRDDALEVAAEIHTLLTGEEA